MEERNNHIIVRFAVIWFFVLLAMIFIAYNIFKIQTVEKENWLALTRSYSKKDIIVRPNRGNIYSCDNQLMASSIPLYYVYMDTRVPALHLGGDTLFRHNIDSVAYSLSNYFKDKSKAQYKRDITKAFKRGRAEYPFYKKMITYSQLKDLKKMPLFRRGRYKSGLLVKEMFKRVKPYTSLASRTIGDIYRDDSKGGKNGLELGFDSILRGTHGVSSRKKIANRWQNIVEVEPIDGLDIVSTVNVDMQDIAEKALVTKLKEIDAKTGYAIVMEVQTGEIKVIVNMLRTQNGNYAERRNGAVADLTEPGSTFKPVALMAVLDDGKATLNDIIDTKNGMYVYGSRKMQDHNYLKGGYGVLTLENALNASSNIGISKTIVKAYGKNPAKFVDKLYQLGINEPFELYIPGTAKPTIPHPNDKSRYWSSTDLPWMSIGYGVQVAPIYTVAFYNAIANNGRFLEPLLVKSINKNGEVVKSFEARVIREQMCKPTTIRDVKKALLGVVEDPKYATAKKVHSKIVRIAGKTGTAQISKGKSGYSVGGKSHQVSFCGFFPFEDPKYTCIVVIREPKIGYPSGGGMAGPVVKNIAERIMAIDTKSTVYDIEDADTTKRVHLPILKSGYTKALSFVMNYLDKPLKATENITSDWAVVSSTNLQYKISPIKTDRKLIPNLSGMGAKDAIYLCESYGLKVKIQGIGKVYSQSIIAGSVTQKGQSIELKLK